MNLSSSCLSLPGPGIIGTHHHTWLMKNIFTDYFLKCLALLPGFHDHFGQTVDRVLQRNQKLELGVCGVQRESEVWESI